MQLAIDLAFATKGQTSPNPSVGAIIVNNGKIAGVGTHLKSGEEHAEDLALQMAGNKAKGATLYVTLEPCSHFGKRPPCINFIIESGIKRVVIGSKDKNPLVAGKGIRELQNANIEVETGILKEKTDQLNQEFNHFIRTNMPFVTLKTAISLDGKMATSAGESKWITGEDARRDVHYYRHQHDAILVGVGTILKDDPLLTTRLPNGGKNPIRIILDHQLRTPIDARVIQDSSAETWIVTGGNISSKKIRLYEQNHVKIIDMANGISLLDLLPRLGELGVTSLFVEGGATVNTIFLNSKLVNQMIVYIAPKLIGGSEAPTFFAGEGFQQMKDALNLQLESVERIGADIKIVAQPIHDKNVEDE